MSPTEAQWAWIAGLFEGEGTVCFTGRTSVHVAVQMTDLDVLTTLNDLVSAPTGPRFARKAQGPTYRDQYQWILSSRDAVRAFLLGIRPWMHSRRGAKIDKALARLAQNKGRGKDRTHCPRGHSYSGDNLYITPLGYRQCRSCKRKVSV